MGKIIIFLLLVMISCSSIGETGELETIDGIIIVTGNEPLTSVVLFSKEGFQYKIIGPLEKDLYEFGQLGHVRVQGHLLREGRDFVLPLFKVYSWTYLP